MSKFIIRFISVLCLVLLTGLSWESRAEAEPLRGAWPDGVDRPWIGPDFWANRLQDWRLANNRIECVENHKNKPMRTLHLTTRRLSHRNEDFQLSIRLGALGDIADDAAAGFLVGAGDGLDYRGACLVHHSGGKGGGLFAGVDGQGRLFVRDFNQGGKKATYLKYQNKGKGLPEAIDLQLEAKAKGPNYTLILTSKNADRVLEQISLDNVDAGLLENNIALVSHPGQGGSFWFDDLELSGSKIEEYEDHHCGPILCSQYTLSKKVLKLTAQLMPIGIRDTHTVEMQIETDLGWKTIARSNVITPGWTAPFKIENWDASKDVPYKLIYKLKTAEGLKDYTWQGTIRHDPIEKETIVVAAFTGNHNTWYGIESGTYEWTLNRVWFPHNQIVDHVRKHKPDVLFFSGDQIYEGASPTGADRKNKPYLDYMYKWYLWCWAYQDLTKEIVTVTIPDDHDVFQGNLWGNSGPWVPKDDHGGYVMPADWVNMVERTQTSHLPDPYDPTPIQRGITVYYTDMTYGRISFAVLEDRKFKSGCAGLIPNHKGRADHIQDTSFDVKSIDLPGLTLLGSRQLDFLHDWASDWRGADFKTALSQTVFAGMATHHGGNLQYLFADLDSNGWPQTGRAKALREIRRGFGFMICGDQHLATLVHHGIDTWEDAGWSMCVPSIANFYPRAWRPPQKPQEKFDGPLDYLGKYRDGFGNPVAIYAHTNPRPMGMEPKNLHDRMPGYGIIKFHKPSREIIVECWPRFADPTSPDAKQYTGWPRTIPQLDNYSRKVTAYLPAIVVDGIEDPVLQVIDESDDDIVYTLRIQGKSFQPFVFKDGTYSVQVGDQEAGRMKTIKNLHASATKDVPAIQVQF